MPRIMVSIPTRSEDDPAWRPDEHALNALDEALKANALSPGGIEINGPEGVGLTLITTATSMAPGLLMEVRRLRRALESIATGKHTAEQAAKLAKTAVADPRLATS
jgi:hypothetical protein